VLIEPVKPTGNSATDGITVGISCSPDRLNQRTLLPIESRAGSRYYPDQLKPTDAPLPMRPTLGISMMLVQTGFKPTGAPLPVEIAAAG
jgi:hypothetical protein